MNWRKWTLSFQSISGLALNLGNGKRPLPFQFQGSPFDYSNVTKELNVKGTSTACPAAPPSSEKLLSWGRGGFRHFRWIQLLLLAAGPFLGACY